MMASIISPERIATLIEDAPAWAVIGLTMPQARMRDDARLELARHVYRGLFKPVDTEVAQLALPW